MKRQNMWINICMAIYMTPCFVAGTIYTCSSCDFLVSFDSFAGNACGFITHVLIVQSFTVNAFVVAVIEKRPITSRLIVAGLLCLLNDVVAILGYGWIKTGYLMFFGNGLLILTWPLVFPYIRRDRKTVHRDDPEETIAN
jgi:hypothetical protein